MTASSGQREVAFFGKITASVTHELNNVISIIDQNAGLLDDLIAGEEQGIPLSMDRLIGVTAAIQKQTERGLGIIERLNRFAHTTDHLETRFDLAEVLGNLVDLGRRLASLKKAELVFKPPAVVVTVSGNPFALQQVVFEALVAMLAIGESGGMIAVTGTDEAGSVLVKIESGIGEGAEIEQALGSAKQLAAKLDGSVAAAVSGNRCTVEVRLPMKCV